MDDEILNTAKNLYLENIKICGGDGVYYEACWKMYCQNHKYWVEKAKAVVAYERRTTV